MAVIVKNSKGNNVMLLNPSEKGLKYSLEIKNKKALIPQSTNTIVYTYFIFIHTNYWSSNLLFYQKKHLLLFSLF